MIAILDYGLGNLGSIRNMLKRIGEDSIITNDKEVIISADKLILPGVGKFDAGIEGLNKADLVPIIKEEILNKKKKILGICLGMQLLLDGSEEGRLEGLGLIHGFSKRFPNDLDLRVPNMGWNEVFSDESCVLTQEVPKPMRFYFAHSYYAKTDVESESVIWTEYGLRYASGIKKENVFGVQFHPEKSHKYGMQLLKNFASL